MRFWKFFGIALIVLAALLAVGITATVGWRPVLGPKVRPTTDRRFETTPARLERGRYLATSVSGCLECHSRLDRSSPPQIVSPAGAGRVFLEQGGMRVVASNLTPDRETGLGSWTDDEIARAVREGVSRDGRTLFPIMPYQHFREMSDEDVASVVVFLRSLEPARNPLPKTQVPFPVSRLINNAPQPVTASVAEPDLGTPVKRGRYMTTLGVCTDCHTPMDKRHMPRHDLEWAGGGLIESDRIASTNLTPDPTGISFYDEALFVNTIRTGRVNARPLHPPMPWWVYRGMSDEDLKAMFAYLRTVKPVAHRVDNTEPPTQCRVCGNRHGFGDRN